MGIKEKKRKENLAGVRVRKCLVLKENLKKKEEEKINNKLKN